MLVALGVIAALIAILLPSIGGARKATREAVDLANLRSTHQQFQQWGVDRQDFFLNAGPPASGWTLVIEHAGHTVYPHYLAQDRVWPWVLGIALGEGYESWHSTSEPPGDHQGNFGGVLGPHVRPTGIRYTQTALSDPRHFRPPYCGSALETSFFRFVRWSEAAYPSQKVLLYDEQRVSSNAQRRPDDAVTAAVFVDGGAALVDLEHEHIDAENGCPNNSIAKTQNGMLGRDFAR